jgi:hypothetical protein
MGLGASMTKAAKVAEFPVLSPSPLRPARVLCPSRRSGRGVRVDARFARGGDEAGRGSSKARAPRDRLPT